MRLLRRWDKDGGDDNIITYLHVSYVHFRPTPPTAPFFIFLFCSFPFQCSFQLSPWFLFLFFFHFPVCLCSRRRLSVCDQIKFAWRWPGKSMRETHSPLLACDQKLPDIRWGGGLYLRHLCVILCVILPFVVFISCNEILFSPILSIFRQKKRAVYQGTAVLAVPDQTEQLRRSIFCCWNPSLSRVSPCVQRCTCVGFSVGCRVFFFIPSLYGYSQVAQLAAVFIG